MLTKLRQFLPFLESDFASRIIQGIAVGFVINIAGVFLALAFRVVLVRVAGQVVYGEYVYVISWVQLLIIVGAMGMHTAPMRFIAHYTGKQDWERLHSFVGYSLRYTLQWSLLTVSILAVVVVLLQGRMEPSLFGAFLAIIPLIPLRSSLHVILQQLVSMKRIFAGQFPMKVGRPIIAMLVLLGVYFLHIELSASRLILLEILTILIIFAISLQLLNLYLPAIDPKTKQLDDKAIWNQFTRRMSIATTLSIISDRLDILLLGLFSSATVVALYSVPISIMQFVSFGYTSVNMMIGPTIAEFHARGDIKKLNKLLGFSAALMFAFTAAVFVFSLFAGRFVLRIFGADFVEGYPILLILAAGLMLQSLTGSSSYIISMTGNEQLTWRILLFSVVFAAIGITLLAPRFGAESVALISVISLNLQQWLFAYFAYRIFGINSTIFALRGVSEP